MVKVCNYGERRAGNYSPKTMEIDSSEIACVLERFSEPRQGLPGGRVEVNFAHVITASGKKIWIEADAGTMQDLCDALEKDGMIATPYRGNGASDLNAVYGANPETVIINPDFVQKVKALGQINVNAKVLGGKKTLNLAEIELATGNFVTIEGSAAIEQCRTAVRGALRRKAEPEVDVNTAEVSFTEVTDPAEFPLVVADISGSIVTKMEEDRGGGVAPHTFVDIKSQEALEALEIKLSDSFRTQGGLLKDGEVAATQADGSIKVKMNGDIAETAQRLSKAGLINRVTADHITQERENIIGGSGFKVSHFILEMEPDNPLHTVEFERGIKLQEERYWGGATFTRFTDRNGQTTDIAGGIEENGTSLFQEGKIPADPTPAVMAQGYQIADKGLNSLFAGVITAIEAGQAKTPSSRAR